jgi:hypothetical protein
MYDYGYTKHYSREDINKQNKEEKMEIMKEWFFENYEDPVNNCPYESAEGGYIYIWGGPYGASDVLYTEFSDIIEEELIQELADELENECSEWSAIPSSSYETEEYKEIFEEEKEPYEYLVNQLNILEKVISDNDNNSSIEIIYKMVLVYSITALETFLSDFFIGKVINDEIFIQQFVKKNKDYQEIKISLSDLFEKHDQIQEIVLEYLRNLIWHNIAKIGNLYKIAFGIEFPKDLGHLYRMITIRHDVVHRGGKAKDGLISNIIKEDITNVFLDIQKLALHIHSSFPDI